MQILGLIPARAGSKGIPGKNLRLLGGRPLLAYAAETALAARRLTRVVLSTEDHEIAALGRELGLDVPFLRPPELARDETPMLPVVEHAIRALEEAGETVDAVCLLQPTSPMRRAADVDACVERLGDGVDAVVSVLPVPHEHNPHWVFFTDDEGFLRVATGRAEPIPRRQELPPAYHRDGSLYLVRRDVVIERGTLFPERMVGYPMEASRHVNLDHEDDWRRAERLLAKSSTPAKR